MFWCNGCNMYHSVNTDAIYSPVVWEFNGDYNKPTFQPSILVTAPYFPRDIRCHSFIIDGKIQYLADCNHELAGKTVEMKEERD